MRIEHIEYNGACITADLTERSEKCKISVRPVKEDSRIGDHFHIVYNGNDISLPYEIKYHYTGDEPRGWRESIQTLISYLSIIKIEFLNGDDFEVDCEYSYDYYVRVRLEELMNLVHRRFNCFITFEWPTRGLTDALLRLSRGKGGQA